MKYITFFLLVFYYTDLYSQGFTKTIFEDDFNSETLNRKWLFYISESVQENGALVCKMPKDAKHSSVNYFRYEPTADLKLKLKFKFIGDAKYLGVIFNDKKYKGSHAGHICNVHITRNNIQLREGKTGVFEHKIREKIKSKTLDQKTKEILRNKEKNVKYKFQAGEWYDLHLVISDSEMTCRINGKVIGKLKSNGISHKTKNSMGLSVWGQSVHIDDFSLKTR